MLHKIKKHLKTNIAQNTRLFDSEIRDDLTITTNGNTITASLPDGEWTLVQTIPENSPCLLYTSPSPRDRTRSRMPSSA